MPEDVVATNVVLAALNGSPFNEIDPPPDEGFELLLHIGECGECRLAVIGERHQHVHIAVGAEVIAQDRAEELQFMNAPSATERLKRLRIERNTGWHDELLLDQYADTWRTWLPLPHHS